MTISKPTNRNNVYITVSESACCLGRNEAEIFDNLCLGKSGITKDEVFFPGNGSYVGLMEHNVSFDMTLLDLCETVLSRSNLKDFSETLLLVGSSTGGIINTEKSFLENGDYKHIGVMENTIVQIELLLKKHFSFRDTLSFSTACTSSANALGYGYECIKKGVYKNVLVVGADSLCHLTVGGFASLGILSKSASKPFDRQREGMNVAEAISVHLLQSDVFGDASIELCGVGYSSDAYHITQPHPEGVGAGDAMKQALLAAGIEKEVVGYINAHGTGTLANDLSEAKAVHRVFGSQTPIGSIKGAIGHTLGAAGAIEAAMVKQALLRQTLPPSTNLNDPEFEDLRYVTKPERATFCYALSNSFAFGGNNTSLIFGLPQ